MKLLLLLAAGVLCMSSVRGMADQPATNGATPVPDATSPLMRQIVAQLNGVPIATAPARDLINAIKRVVEANPKDAAAILTGVLAVERPDMPDIVAQAVVAAIQGLGPAASNLLIAQAVQAGVQLQPEAVLNIVRSSVQATNCSLVPAIVQAARAALGKEKESGGKDVVPLDKGDGKNTVAVDGKRASSDETLMQIVQAAYDARPGCYADPAALLAAVEALGQDGQQAGLPAVGEGSAPSSPWAALPSTDPYPSLTLHGTQNPTPAPPPSPNTVVPST